MTVVSVSFLSEVFLFFHVEENGILVENTYSYLRLLPNLDLSLPTLA